MLAAGAVLMCLGVRWLFFLGAGLLLISSSFSLRPRTASGWLRRFVGWLSWLAALALFLLLSSLGREPPPWGGACAGVFAVSMGRLDYWRASRRMAQNA